MVYFILLQLLTGIMIGALHCCTRQLVHRMHWSRSLAGMQISVSRAGPYGTATTAKNGPSGSAYVTYRASDDARRCIAAVHGATWDGESARLLCVVGGRSLWILMVVAIMRGLLQQRDVCSVATFDQHCCPACARRGLIRIRSDYSSAWLAGTGVIPAFDAVDLCRVLQPLIT